MLMHFNFQLTNKYNETDKVKTKNKLKNTHDFTQYEEIHFKE